MIGARKTAAGLLAAIAILGLGACTREEPKPTKLRPVLTAVVGTSTAADMLTFSGEIRSRIEQTLAFRVPGKIAARKVDAGSVVRSGDLLVQLDPVDTALASDAAEVQRRLADADLRRFRELRDRNFVSQAALDARETALKASTAQADLARNQASYTRLHADQGGVVAAVLAEVGQVVAAGQPILRLARPDAPEVAISIPEARVADVRKLGEIEIELWSDRSRTYRGRLRELGAVADPATRTFAARVAIESPDAAIVLGMTANVRFSSAQRSRLHVPLSALFQQDGKPAVWLVGQDSTVQLRPVEVARYTADSVELAAGLQNGDRIVVAGVHKLAAGETIRVAERNQEGSLVEPVQQ